MGEVWKFSMKMVKFDNENRSERIKDPESLKEIWVWHKKMVRTLDKEWVILNDRRWSARLN